MRGSTVRMSAFQPTRLSADAVRQGSFGSKGEELIAQIWSATADHRLPEVARMCLTALGSQLRSLKAQIPEFDRRIIAWLRSNVTSKQLDAIPGVVPALATALVASIADPKVFRSGRTSRPGSGSCRSRARGPQAAYPLADDLPRGL